MYEIANNILPKTNNVFANYTGHGIEHSISVMKYMADLVTDVSSLNDLEITVMIYVALLHDIGMVVTDDDIKKIKNDDFIQDERKFSLVLEKYQDETLALQEYIRPIHGILSAKFIDENIKNDLFTIPNSTTLSFKEEVENICRAHNEDFEWLKRHLSQEIIIGKYALNAQYIAILLRLADLLDIDEKRTPLYLYKLINPKGYSSKEWEQHFVITNDDKITKDENSLYKSIKLYGKSDNPDIHRKLLRYFEYINNELNKAVSLSKSFKDSTYTLLLETNIDNKIETKGFSFSDFKLKLDYFAVTNLLMGENIYGDKKYGLRELLQNSIDACKVMSEVSKGKKEFLYKQYEPCINIVFDYDNKTVSIMDNGIGMSLDTLQNYFLNVGKSYYTSDDYLFKGYDYNPIGNYGIGFLACLMLSDKVTVQTKRYEDTKSTEVELEKNSEYICLTCNDDAKSFGTTVILNLDQFFNVFKPGIDDVKNFVEENFIDCGIPIKIIQCENQKRPQVSCTLDKLKENSTEYARLDKYLNDIEAGVELICNIKPIFKLRDMAVNPYVYTENDDILPEEKLNSESTIKDFIKNGTISHMRIPIVKSEYYKEFNDGLAIFHDRTETFYRLPFVDFISIFCNDYNKLFPPPNMGNPDDKIIGNLTFKNYCEKIGHDFRLSVWGEVYKLNVISTDTESYLLKYETFEELKNHSWQTDYKIFIRNVYIPAFEIILPALISQIRIKSVLFNIKNKHIKPNVSRNDVSPENKAAFSYAIGKALHLWILDNIELSPAERNLINKFIETCYPHDNVFLKQHSQTCTKTPVNQ